MTVVKVIELVGSSEKSWQDAVESTITRSAKTIRNLRGVDVIGLTGKIENGKIIEYRSNVRISFTIDEVTA